LLQALAVLRNGTLSVCALQDLAVRQQ
jgi:hypothetical protein